MFYYGATWISKVDFYLWILNLVKEINEIKVFRMMVMVIIVIICEENKTIGFVF